MCVPLSIRQSCFFVMEKSWFESRRQRPESQMRLASRMVVLLLLVCSQGFWLCSPAAQAFTDEVGTHSRSSLPPTHSAYTRLQQALASYRQMAAHGGWPILPDGAILRKGDQGTPVAILTRRLHSTGDLTEPPAQRSDLFDAVLEQAVRRFQRRHGVVADGVVGPITRAALQVPIEARMRQMAINLERWGGLPPDLGRRYILVNIPSFTLHVVVDDQPVMSMRVVVGKPSWPTPVLSASLVSLVLHPTWEVPARIARQELLPRIRHDSTYLSTHRIRIVQHADGETRDIDPRTLDWSRLTAQHFPYHLRQKPGPTNPLGRVKFLMPNRFQVTLHDTPTRSLFAHPIRAYSHGCIRLEQPLALAAYLLQDDPSWTPERPAPGPCSGRVTHGAVARSHARAPGLSNRLGRCGGYRAVSTGHLRLRCRASGCPRWRTPCCMRSTAINRPSRFPGLAVFNHWHVQRRI